MEGKLVRLYRDLRYGFIKAHNTDYFFHQTDFQGNWKVLCDDFDEGIKPNMEFQPDSTDKGLRARKVVHSAS